MHVVVVERLGLACMYAQIFICKCCCAIYEQFQGAIVVYKVSTWGCFLTAMAYFDSDSIFAENCVVMIVSIEHYETYEDI